MRFPYDWQPHIVSTSLATIGDFTIVAVPGEFTTMAGRRLRNAVKQALRLAQQNVTQQSNSSVSNTQTSTSWTSTVNEFGQVVNITESSFVTSGSEGSGVSSATQGNNTNNLLTSIFQDGSPVVIAGLCDTYSSYIVTYEEYTVS
jgi:hypothetical protein